MTSPSSEIGRGQPTNRCLRTVAGERDPCFCEGPSFVATLERLEIFMATRRAKVSSGFKGSDSLSYHEDLDWFSIAFYKTPESTVFSAHEPRPSVLSSCKAYRGS